MVARSTCATVSQVRAAQAIVNVASVQVSLSPLEDENLRNGVAEYCAEQGIQLIAYRPLGGERVMQLTRDAALSQIAAKHSASNGEIALAWLMSFRAGIVPIPGATRVATAASLARVLGIELDEEDRRMLDARFSGRLLRVPRAARRPHDDAVSDVIIVMGMPGAGKSTVACALESEGYERLNRDEAGGSLGDLAPRLDELLGTGHSRVVVDNTYPTRKARNEIIETAWARGVTVRCIWLTTSLADAQINAIRRMIDAHGSLAMPEEIRERSRRDTRYFLPDAQFRYERTLEPPTLDEGFKSIEERSFAREPDAGREHALILDFDDLIGRESAALCESDVVIDRTRVRTLKRYNDAGWRLFVHAWRPQVARDEVATRDVDACLAKMRNVLGIEVDTAYCPHDAGPPVCWCRKPIPGSVIEFATRRGVALSRSIVIGASAADRTMAERLGARFEESESFFATPHG